MAQQIPTQKEFLTQKALAKRWKLSERFLQHDRLNKQTIPFIKLNNLVRYDLADIEQVEANKIGGIE